jgi:hypothetical protein
MNLYIKYKNLCLQNLLLLIKWVYIMYLIILRLIIINYKYLLMVGGYNRWNYQRVYITAASL